MGNQHSKNDTDSQFYLLDSGLKEEREGGVVKPVKKRKIRYGFFDGSECQVSPIQDFAGFFRDSGYFFTPSGVDYQTPKTKRHLKSDITPCMH